MATASVSLGTGVVTLTGSGYTGSKVSVVASYVATDNKRRALEMYAATITAGAISYDVPIRYTSGTLTIKTVDTSATVLATSSGQAV